MLIRPLTAADVADFSDLRLAAIDNAPSSFWPTRDEELSRSTEDMASRLRPNRYQTIFGAYQHDVLVGIAGFRREVLRQVRHKGDIWGVYVAPEWRGQGVARALLTTIIEHARQLGDVTQLKLCVNTQNLAARELYLSLGFEVFGLEPRSMLVEGVYHGEEHRVLFLDSPTPPSPSVTCNP